MRMVLLMGMGPKHGEGDGDILVPTIVCFTFHSARKISMFWSEKFMLLFNFLQIHALLFVLSFPWPWPLQ